MKKKIVICINNQALSSLNCPSAERWLTIGKEYEVIRDIDFSGGLQYEIVGDNGLSRNPFAIRFKIKEMNLQEQINKVKEDFNNQLAHLEKQLKEQEITKFKENDWITDGTNLFKVDSYTAIGSILLKESYTEKGNDLGKNDRVSYDQVKYLRLATREKIEKILIAVAKKKYPEGTDYHPISISDGKCSNNVYTINLERKGEYFENTDCLSISGNVYMKGLWAEIVKNEFPTILGYKNEGKKNEVKYGCKSYHKNQIFQLYEQLLSFKIESFKIAEGEVKSSEIEQIIKAYDKNS